MQGPPAEDSFSRRYFPWVLVGAGAALLAMSALLTALGTETRFVPLGPAAAPDDAGRPPARGDWSIDLLRMEPALERGAWDHLRVKTAGHDELVELRPDATVSIAGVEYHVAAVRTWRGLLTIADGRPAASVSVYDGDQALVEDVFIADGQRVRIDDGPAIALHWHGNAEESHEAAGGARVRDTAPRWGVADGGRVHWFENFEAGTGVTLDDGTVVILERFIPGEAAQPGEANEALLVVQWGAGEEAEHLRIVGPSDDPPVFVQYPKEDTATFHLHAHDTGRAEVLFASPDIRDGPVKLASGERWQPRGASYAVRIEQVLPGAAPVARDSSPFFEAVLESAAGRVRVRQGEAVRVGDALLRYVRRPHHASTAFRMRLQRDQGGSESFVLYPHEREVLDLGGQRWLASHGDVRPGEGLWLRQRAGGVRWVRLAGMVIFIAGLVAVMMRRPAAR